MTHARSAPCPKCGAARWPNVVHAVTEGGELLSEYTCWLCAVTWSDTARRGSTFIKTDVGYSLAVDDVVVTASRVRWNGDELSMEVTITTAGDVVGPILLMPLKPASRRDVLTMAGLKDNRTVTQALSDLCRQVVERERRSVSQIVVLRDVAKPDIDAQRLSIDPLPPLYRTHPTIWFGDGGVAKSIQALFAAGKLAEQGLRVLYLDWELDEGDHRLRYEQMFGAAMPESVLYLKCDKPLPQITDTIQRTIKERQIDYAIVDSIGYAAGGAPEAAEVATFYQQCVRGWRIGSLHLAHTTKGARDGGTRPFGSTYWHNGARETWSLSAGKVKRLSDTAKETEISWQHCKDNFGTLEPTARKYRLTGDTTTLTLTRRLIALKETDGQKLRNALRVRPMERDALRERLGWEAKKLRAVIRREKKQNRITEEGTIVSIVTAAA